MPKKKIIALISVITICLALFGGGTYTYLTREAVARSVITTGRIEVSIVADSTGGSHSDPIPMMPGKTVEKNAQVRTANGTQESYIRARIDIEIRDIVNWPVSVTAEELDSIIELPRGSGWVEKDGWLYYEQPLKAGETTTDVFESVSFAENMSNKYQNCTATVTVTAQAVQVKNNGTGVMDAEGWPEA